MIRTFTKPVSFRHVPVSDRAMEVLAEHALQLRPGHPVRSVITAQLERYAVSDDFDYGCPHPVSREQFVDMLANADCVGSDLVEALCERLDVSDADVAKHLADNDPEAVMRS